MMKPIKLAITFMLSSTALAQAPVPKDGFVPDKATAIRVAEAVLPPICGCVDRNRPFTAVLDKGVWTVIGKQPHTAKGEVIFGGGEVEMHIDQRTGAILSYVFIK